MKRILIVLISLVLSTSLYAQNNEDDLPRYYLENKDTIGLIISIKQAQKIDNDLEILKLFKESAIKTDSLEKQYLLVIDKLENKVGILEIKSLKQDSVILVQGKMVAELNKLIDNYKQDIAKCDEQHVLKDKIISNQKDDIRKLKLKKNIGFIVAAVLGVLLVISVVSK